MFGVHYGVYENGECWIRGGVGRQFARIIYWFILFFSIHLPLRQPNIFRKVRVSLGLGEG